ncbi:hypothetical protein MRB53_011677 [Persea americana]|uniref:Uncharacterized protein n=1 Tax=Persea americana TaxID=3435 RepID=A0ACC2LVL0_PERAE|nr:hypothetical protein MRB53_011677 [Persea americana]
MGCCYSKSTDSRANRIQRWRSTGIVALRDSKLKTFPIEVLDLDKSVRTLDLSHNKIGNLIEDLPPSICNLTHLKSLCLNNNNVRQIEGFQEFEARRKKKWDEFDAMGVGL